MVDYDEVCKKLDYLLDVMGKSKNHSDVYQRNASKVRSWLYNAKNHSTAYRWDAVMVECNAIYGYDWTSKGKIER
jgi:hypothetical protein